MVGDYAASEEIAISAGKRVLRANPWLSTGSVAKPGFFAELKENDKIHSGHYEVHCVDGVGTKLFLAAWMNRYDTVGIDAVAMNANDMATLVHAVPDAANIYLACQQGIEEEHMGAIMEGFVAGFKQLRGIGNGFGVSIAKLETATLDEMVSLGVPGKGFDIALVMNGWIEKDKLPNLEPKPGHYIVGLTASGLHSNGYTGARRILLNGSMEPRGEWRMVYRGKFGLDDTPEILQGRTVGDALLEPTLIYSRTAWEVGKMFSSRDIYGVNITGNGFRNFNRAGEGVSFEITDPLPTLPIHELVVQEARYDPEKAYSKFNMGTGFAFVVPDLETAERVVEMINGSRLGQHAQIIGEVAASSDEKLRTTIHKPYDNSNKRVDLVGY